MLEKIKIFTVDTIKWIFAFTPKKISFLLALIFTGLFTLQNFISLLPSLPELKTYPIFSQLYWVKNLDYDLHLKYIPERPVNKNIVVVEINEPTLRALGRFPFSRSVYVKLLERLNAAKASVLAFDIVFAEKEQENVIRQLEDLLPLTQNNKKLYDELGNKIKLIDGDGALLKAIQASKIPVVLGYTFKDRATKNHYLSKTDELGFVSKEQLRVLNIFGGIRKSGSLTQKDPEDAFVGVGPILPIDRYTADLLNGSKVLLGNFNAVIDTDGVIREAPVITNFNGSSFSSLWVKALQAHLKEEAYLKKNGNNFFIHYETAGLKIPMDSTGGMPVKYYGAGRDFTYAEMIDVLQNKNEKYGENFFKDKIVFLGVTAAGLKDLRTTPMAADYPGVEIHATAVSNVLDQDFLSQTNTYYIFGYLLMGIIAYFFSVFLFRLHPMLGLILTGFAIAGAQIVAQKLFYNRGIIVPTILPSAQFIFILFSAVLYRYLSTEKEKQYVREAFGRYVSKVVVDEMLKDHDKLKLGGQKKRLTVLFSDMVGFTKLSEGLDAEKLSTLLNEFFTIMTQIILDNGGTLDKYMGDAIMCFWGAPLDNPKHETLACKAALEMQIALADINKRWKEKFGFTVGMRIGINTGDMAVGNMGSEQVFSYTVLGDNVNLGSRLEGVNNFYGTWIICGEETYSAANNQFFFRELDKVAVKGKDHAVCIYELIGPHPQRQSVIDWVHAFDLARKLYVEKEWDEARNAFQLCITMNPDDKASKAYIERMDEVAKESLPHNWDGVWKLTAK